MRKGYTTGTCATAASKAHGTFLLTGEKPEFVEVIMPDGSEASIGVKSCDEAGACVVKDAGDDPDVTHGSDICAHVELTSSDGIIIKGGVGVGTVTKAGLQIPIGKPAINPVPLDMIRKNLLDAGIRNCVVTIFVPNGVELAKQTFNSRIGIEGGISIIGTTGIVEPMSMEALTATIACEIDVLAENGADEIYLVPGKIGEKHLQKLLPEIQTVIMSNYVGFALEHTLKRNIHKITLAGHPGKLAKIAMGYYNTHSKQSPMAQNFISELLELGEGYNTVEEICEKVDRMDKVAEMISKEILSNYPFESTKILLFDMAGNLKGRWDG